MKILIGESDSILRARLVKAFEQSHYVVDVATDGEEALYKVMNYPYKVVVLADDLPNMSGLEIVKRARRHKVDSFILMLAAQKSPMIRVEGLDNGADDYIVKPPDLDELRARVRVLVRRHGLEGCPLIVSQEVEFNQNTGRVSKRGEEVLLTGREFKILKVLFLNLGSVVPKSKVYDEIESDHENSMSNLLEVHLCSLRKKLGKDFIKTFRGRGYMIERD